MTSLGFENYGEALKIYLARYREVGTCETPETHFRSTLIFNRTSLPVASINVLVNQALRENLVPLTTALTTLSLSGTQWIHPRKAPPTSLVTQLRISLSTRGTIIEPSTHQQLRPFLPFRCIYVAIGLPLEQRCRSPRSSDLGSRKLTSPGAVMGLSRNGQHERRFKPISQQIDPDMTLDRTLCDSRQRSQLSVP